MEFLGDIVNDIKVYGKNRSLSLTLAILISLGVAPLSGCSSKEEVSMDESIMDVIDDTTYIDDNLNCNDFKKEEETLITNINKYEKGFGNKKEEVNEGLVTLASDILKGLIANALMIPEINFKQIEILNNQSNYYAQVALNDGTILNYNLFGDSFKKILEITTKAKNYEFDKESGTKEYSNLKNILKYSETLVLDNNIYIVSNKVKNLKEEEKDLYMKENISNSISKYGYAKGIDVSYCQSGVDYETLFKVNKDITFMYSRSFYFWSGGEINPNFITSCKIANENGIACGTYYWPTCQNPESALQETIHFINTINEITSENDFSLDLPIVLDIELLDSGGCGLLEKLSGGDYNAWSSLAVVVDTLKKSDRNVILYFSDWFTVDERLKHFKEVFDVDIWAAKYPTDEVISFDSNLPECDLECSDNVMWQYTENGVITSNPGKIFLFDTMNENLLKEEYNKQKMDYYASVNPINSYIPSSTSNSLTY